MATIELGSIGSDEQNEGKGIPVSLDFEPYNGEVVIHVVPKTRTLLMEAVAKAKKNPKYRRHTVRDSSVKGGRRVVEGDENAAFMEELADLIIEDWSGVEQDGVPVECVRENKIKLFNNLRISNFLLEVAEDLADTIGKEVEKNS
jgi:hypothetical protein